MEVFTTPVESEPDMLVQALVTEETWTDVGVAPSNVAVDKADDSVVAMLVTDATVVERVDRLVLSVVSPVTPEEMLLLSVAPPRVAEDSVTDTPLSAMIWLEATAEIDEDNTTLPDVCEETLVLSVVRPIVAVEISAVTDDKVVLSATRPEVAEDRFKIAVEMPDSSDTVSVATVVTSLLTSSASTMPPAM